jgi:uncharacterized membrane protein HdeD (DUF308 family)
MSTPAIGASTGPPAEVEAGHRPRWGFLAAGCAWIVASLLVLAFDERSVRVVGVMIGFVLMLAAATQFVEVIVAPSWKWAHGAVAVVMILAGSAAFSSPLQTVRALSLLVGVALVVKGAVSAAQCLARRDHIVWWGLSLGLALGEVVVGLWAIGYPGRSLTLLLVWVGAAAMLRGVEQIVLAFNPRDGG